MSILPFTPAGVAEKQEQLYVLSDNDLYVQAKAIVADFSGWLASNFTLSPKQYGYLDSMPDFVRFEFGAILTAVVMVREQLVWLYLLIMGLRGGQNKQNIH